MLFQRDVYYSVPIVILFVKIVAIVLFCTFAVGKDC